jgi:UDP-glucose 4-epimerase
MTDWRAYHGKFFEGTRVLVTGGMGFIGSHLAEALEQLGADLIVFDDGSSSDGTNIAHLHRVTTIRDSILDPAAVRAASSGCQYVFHQAALVSVPASVNKPVQYHQVNEMGTVHVLEACRLNGVKRLMFAASSSAYGDSETLPKVETMVPNCRSPYAASKAACEQILRAYAACYELDTISLRYFNIFGPRQNTNSAYAGVIAAFARMLFNGENPNITGDGTATRDFTFVHNAVHANLLAARSDKRLDGAIVNIAVGKRVSITELATKMAQLAGRPDLKPVYSPPRPGDVMHSLAELSLAKQVLGYVPIVDFDAGLKATVDWYRSALKRP